MKISEVIKANKEIKILNLVRFNKWYNDEISFKYKNMLSYDMSHANLLEMDMTKKEINEYYISYAKSLENDKNFNKLIKTLKDTETKKMSDKVLLKEYGLDDYFNNWNDVKCFIINSVLPEIESLNI